MARLRQESDTSLYRSKEDRIVISGITSKSPIPTDNKKRIDYLKKIAVEIFETLIKDFRGKIKFLVYNITNLERCKIWLISRHTGEKNYFASVDTD
jgi:hypothetical protein